MSGDLDCRPHPQPSRFCYCGYGMVYPGGDLTHSSSLKSEIPVRSKTALAFILIQLSGDAEFDSLRTGTTTETQGQRLG